MKALLRPAFVLGLSIAIAATSLIGSSSVAFAANLSRPLITARWLDGLAYEGAPTFLNGTFTDGTDRGPYTVDVDWGDGTFDQYALPDANPLDPPTRSFRVQKTAPYANDLPGALIMVTLNDPPFFTTRTLSVTVLNAAPSFTSFGLSATEMEAGQEVTATGAFTDGGASDTHTVTLNWGDGTPTTTTSLGAALSFTTDPHTYTTADVFTVTATVTDDAGATAVATSTVSVRPPNQAPTIVSFGVTVGSEGGDTTLALTFADVDALDTHTVSVAWGDGQTTNSGTLAATEVTFDATHVYADTGNYSLVLTLTDSATPTHTVTETRSVSPTNVDPVLGALSVSSSVVDPQELTLSGSFTDPGTADTFALTVNWGAGALPPQPLGTARSFSVTHVYDAAGPVTITATVEDRDGGKSTSSVELVVLPRNHAPAGLVLEPSVTGPSVTINGRFTDSDADDTHTVVLTWGHGATAWQTLDAGVTTFTASHVYGESGTYTVEATVTDQPAGASTSATTQVAATVPAESASAVLDEMSWLVRGFDLDRNTERWLLKKLDDVQGALAYGNGQVCFSNGTLSHIMAFAQRTLASEQYAALSAFRPDLEAAAGCTSSGSWQTPKVQRAAAVTTTVTPALPETPAPTQKKDTTMKAKSAKSDSKPAGGRSSHK